MADSRQIKFHFPPAYFLKRILDFKSLNYDFEKPYELTDIANTLENPDEQIIIDLTRTAWEWSGERPWQLNEGDGAPAERKSEGIIYSKTEYEKEDDTNKEKYQKITDGMLKDAKAAGINRDEIAAFNIFAHTDSNYQPQQGGIFSAIQVLLPKTFLILEISPKANKVYVVTKPDGNHLNVLVDITYTFQDMVSSGKIGEGRARYNFEIERKDDTFFPHTDHKNHELWIPEAVWLKSLERAQNKLNESEFDNDALFAFVPLLADPEFLEAFLEKFKDASEEKWEVAREYMDLCFAGSPVLEQIYGALIKKKLILHGLDKESKITELKNKLKVTTFSNDDLLTFIPFLFTDKGFLSQFLRKYKEQPYEKRTLARIYLESYYPEQSARIISKLSRSNRLLNFLDYIAFPVSWSFRRSFDTGYLFALKRWGKGDRGIKRAKYLGYGLGILSALLVTAALVTALVFAAPFIAKLFVGTAMAKGISVLVVKMGIAAESVYAAGTVLCLSALNAATRAIYKARVAFNKKYKVSPQDPASPKPLSQSKRQDHHRPPPIQVKDLKQVNDKKRKQLTGGSALFNKDQFQSTANMLSITKANNTADGKDEAVKTGSELGNEEPNTPPPVASSSNSSPSTPEGSSDSHPPPSPASPKRTQSSS